MAQIIPTVGRKLYFYPQGDASVNRIDDQPIDAMILYVHPKTSEEHSYSVNLMVVDHFGVVQVKKHVVLIQDGDAEPAQGYYAKWMPYQIGQAKIAAPTVEPQSEPVNAPAPESQSTQPTASDFGAALSALKSGKAATRRAWGPKVFIYLVPAASYKAQTGIAKKVFGEDALVPYMPYLAIKRADDKVCVFNPGIDSILAEDWEISQ